MATQSFILIDPTVWQYRDTLTNRLFGNYVDYLVKCIIFPTLVEG